MDQSFKYSVCRLCLYKSEKLIDIFGTNSVLGYVAAEVIEDLLQVRVCRSDGFPQSVCTSCVDKLTDFKIFKDQCKGSMVAFENGFDHERFHFSDSFHPDSMNFSPASLVKVEMIMPDAEDHDEVDVRQGSHGPYFDVDVDNMGVGMEFQGAALRGVVPKKEQLRGGRDDLELSGFGARATGTASMGHLLEGVGAIVTSDEGESKPYGCGICNKRFARSNKLVQHIRLHTGEAPFVCEDDVHQGSHGSYLDVPLDIEGIGVKMELQGAALGGSLPRQDQVKGSQGEVATTAVVPRTTALTLSDMMNGGGMVVPSGDEAKPYGCGICSKRFARSNKLVQHIRTHTGERPFVCEVCGRAFNRKDKLSLHRKTHNSEKPYQCPSCEKAFCRSDYLLQHRKSHHPEEEILNYPCSECSLAFAKETELNAHISAQHFTCQECGRLFATEADLTAHLESVAQNGAHLSCVECGKTFDDREKLRKHGKVHRRDTEYSCEWCGKVFYRMDKMLQHRRVHTKERPYSCDICGKLFSRSDKMTEHRRIHDTSFKPYECPECLKRFTRSDYLLQHRKTHIDDAKKFKCDQCEKKFVSNKDLVVHRRTHSGEKPFECQECGKSFKRKGALNAHKKVTHPAGSEVRDVPTLLDKFP